MPYFSIQKRCTQKPILTLKFPSLQCLLNPVAQMVLVYRFENVVLRAVAYALNHRIYVVHGRDDDYRYLGPSALYLLDEFSAAHMGHDEVQQYELGFMLGNEGQDLSAVVHGDDVGVAR